MFHMTLIRRSTMLPVLALVLALPAAALLADELPEPKFEHQQIDKIDIGYGLAIGDVDGDKKDDILLADAKQIVWYRNPGGDGGGEWKKHVMAENLTPRDNVCITAADINGDGKVEVAVGAMWNPGETSNPKLSGAVFYLVRPEDPTKKWTPMQITPHEPTTHRMHWVQLDKDTWHLVVLPLHGRGNKGGEGDGVKIIAYEMPDDPKGAWKMKTLDDSMHMTHNFDVIEFKEPAELGGETMRGALIAGKEGLKGAMVFDGEWTEANSIPQFDQPAGEVRAAPSAKPGGRHLIATIEPMHGDKVVAYHGTDDDQQPTRTVLDDTLRQGHAVAIADVLGIGRPQVVAGWRNPNSDNKVGVKLYAPTDAQFSEWKTFVIDDNKMATEDLKIADLNGDGKPDLIAAGRATKNLKIYWNQTGK